MAERLLLCGGCQRHVRCSEVTCPFCGIAVSTAPTPPREPFQRMAAAAAVAAGVAALTGTGCSAANAGGASYDGSGPLGDGASGLFDASVGGGEDGSIPFPTSMVVFYGGPGVVTSSGATCMTSEGCLPGQVCCGTLGNTISCQAGPCPQTSFGSIQLCGVSAECLAAGATCGPPKPPLPSLPIKVCNAPGDGGTDEGGIDEGGSASDGGNDTDAGIDDAPADG
jgi:hypothetical protein